MTKSYGSGDPGPVNPTVKKGDSKKKQPIPKTSKSVSPPKQGKGRAKANKGV